MKLIYKTISGFKFVKIGEFYKCDEPYQVKFEGKEISIDLSIKLISDMFKQSDESAYLIFVNDNLVYVGEYSYNFEDRWLRKSKYVWHNTDDRIEEQLLLNNNVSLWLSVDPFIILPDDSRINISKSIEQEILKKEDLVWNKRGKMKKYSEWREANCTPVISIIQKLESQ